MGGPTSAGRAISPFQKLNDRLAGIAPGLAPINLGLGEPQHPIPAFVGPVIAANLDLFGRYPAIRGTDAFRATVAAWLNRRYGLAASPVDPETMVLPLNGSREGLFFAALGARERAAGIARPAVLLPNPFYQAYAAGAEAAGLEIVLIDAGPDERHLPDLSRLAPDILARTIALYVASPTNPQGSVATSDDWRGLIAAARQHDFMIFADECYSEIYRSTPPPGVLEAAAGLGGGFANIVTFHSLSKRSNLPGLRAGFAAGDPVFLKDWTRLRNMAAPQVPTPIQAVAVAAYSDEAHVAENRALYNRKFELAQDLLGVTAPEGGFFLWLEVGDGEEAAIRLWREVGVRTIPGAYLCLPTAAGDNPGRSFLRVAMVQDIATTTEALRRMAQVLG
ncbi:aminotransferase class I/II-fold pyridoxal phosphate-dependent enzyme [Mesorhizobium sp. BR1-1-16]|uniref:aminotransferase class I/II-fold pyridoxal phosphate-dependent enzyme n=1 Tax=Mesorhizobium sp. BR1-1-16 TaxID=2876653 RepID=UPI001CCB9ACE|nr:aminotransferase class I/II-fold pyridoxal phosphate-dependent enzyme [Mesorhizobium sp. BR1-1-16]MBZ9937957.1 aminotransferase class I/II-fold pyridoxal phosphate-dependent enzyme [Mesorhizobium sp. BR1-1-16]